MWTTGIVARNGNVTVTRRAFYVRNKLPVLEFWPVTMGWEAKPAEHNGGLLLLELISQPQRRFRHSLAQGTISLRGNFKSNP